MVTKTKKRKSAASKDRFIGKPKGLVQDRVKAVGPEHFGVVAVDCAKRRSKWMLCDFYGKVIVEPKIVAHASGTLRAMTQQVADVCKSHGLSDCIAAIEMTGIPEVLNMKAVRRQAFGSPSRLRTLILSGSRVAALRCPILRSGS